MIARIVANNVSSDGRIKSVNLSRKRPMIARKPADDCERLQIVLNGRVEPAGLPDRLDHERSPCSSRFLQYGDRLNNTATEMDGLRGASNWPATTPMNRDPQPRYRRRRSELEHRPQYRPRPRRDTDPAQSSTIWKTTFGVYSLSVSRALIPEDIPLPDGAAALSRVPLDQPTLPDGILGGSQNPI